MNHIPTLLLREWMQHKRGWLIAAFAPPLLFLAMLPFGQVKGLPMEQAELLSLVILVVSACAGYAICLVVGLFQLPGLARRDQQDRSIEFWLSLPGRPSESVAGDRAGPCLAGAAGRRGRRHAVRPADRGVRAGEQGGPERRDVGAPGARWSPPRRRCWRGA